MGGDPDLAERHAGVPRASVRHSSPHEALKLGSRQVDCLVYRFALLRTLGDLRGRGLPAGEFTVYKKSRAPAGCPLIGVKY